MVENGVKPTFFGPVDRIIYMVGALVSRARSATDLNGSLNSHGNHAERTCRDRSQEGDPGAEASGETLLRVRVVGGGCSGFSYDLGFDNTFDEKLDSKYDQHGVTVVVDKKSALYLDGTTVDFYDGLEKRGFTFDNPNAVKTCGCGSSFQA